MAGPGDPSGTAREAPSRTWFPTSPRLGDPIAARPVSEIASYSIADGGPLRALESRCGITRRDGRDWLRRAAVYVALAELPALALGSAWRAATGEWPALIARWDIHVRALIAAPLLLLAEVLVEQRARSACAYLLDSGIVPPGQREAYRTAIARSVRWRNAGWFEAGLLAAALWSTLAPASIQPNLPLPHAWSGLASLALFRFVVFRWGWRWLLWASLLWRLSRLRLEVSALHPDRIGGLEPLTGPSHSFAVAIAGGAASLAGSYADRIQQQGAALTEFYNPLVLYVCFALLLAAAPLLPFMGVLRCARRAAVERYGAFARRYCDAFERRWFSKPGEQALGTPDIQTLADLGSSFSVALQMQALPFSRRLAVAIIAAALIPLVPLLLTQISLPELLVRLFKALM